MSKDLKSSIESIKTTFDLDGTEIYNSDGQTVCDLDSLSPGEVLEILDIKKEFPKEPNKIIR